MNQRYMMVAGTVRQVLPNNNVVDIPTIIRLDTQTGQAWFAEGLPQGGFSWLNIIERGAPPAHV